MVDNKLLANQKQNSFTEFVIKTEEKSNEKWIVPN